MIYTFKNGYRIKGIDPQKAGESLEELRKNGDGIKTESVVNMAKKPTSPLHPAFEWDDSKAAKKFRLEQARYLIRSIQVTIDTTSPPEPAFVNIASGGISYYQATRVACQNADEWPFVYKEAQSALMTASERLDNLDRVSRKVRHKSSKAITRANATLGKAITQIESVAH